MSLRDDHPMYKDASLAIQIIKIIKEVKWSMILDSATLTEIESLIIRRNTKVMELAPGLKAQDTVGTKMR